MPQDDRQGFKDWKTDLIFQTQEGRCANCGCSLENTGFFVSDDGDITEKVEGNYHKHHSNKDHTDDSLTNEILLCPRCHWSTYGDANPYTKFQEQNTRILDGLNDLINQALSNKMSGASMDKLIEAMTLSLKQAKEVTRVNEGIFYTPPSVKLQRRMADQEAKQDAYFEGYSQAVKDTLSRVNLERKNE